MTHNTKLKLDGYTLHPRLSVRVSSSGVVTYILGYDRAILARAW